MADGKKGKKRSKAFYVQGSSSASKKMRRDKFLDVGMRGFLLTCNRVEHLCIRDGYSLLGEYADTLYGPERMGGDNASSDNECESEPEDIEASLRKEVAQIKQQRAQKETRFEAINSGAKNVIFIRTKLPDPTELVHYILTDIATTQICKSCHIMRMLPVNVACRATTEDITKHVPEFLHPYFHADGVSPSTFAVRIKIRNNASVKRDDVIKLVAGIVMDKGIKHKVDLDNPEMSVIVEIIKNVCCLSVVRDFNKLKRYNLQEIVSDGGAAQKATPGRIAKETRGATEEMAQQQENNAAKMKNENQQEDLAGNEDAGMKQQEEETEENSKSKEDRTLMGIKDEHSGEERVGLLDQMTPGERHDDGP